MQVNKFNAGDKVKFCNTYEQVMDGKEGVIKGYFIGFGDVTYTVECNGRILKNIPESELISND